MTLHPVDQWRVPSQTARVAHAAFPSCNIYLKMYDQLGQLDVDSDFQSSVSSALRTLQQFPQDSLALITVMQFAFMIE